MARRQPVSLRISDDVRAAIAETARRTRRDFSSIANEMLEEAVRMRRIPGIVFADGPAGRRARIAGTGLEVFEIIEQYRAVEQDWERLKEGFHWLNEHQLRAALAYAEAYPEEIEEWLKGDFYSFFEEAWAQYPYMKPPWR